MWIGILRPLKPLALISAMGFSGCATFVKYNCQATAASTTIVDVRTTPKGATGRFASGRTFTTPAQLVLRSEEDITFTLAKEGYKPVEVFLESQVDPWFAGNILPIPLPLVGFAVDIEQGAIRTLYPSTVDITLEPAGD